ncbi:MAG: DUF2752 domain-containing protein [Lachnospiraceae bacterium]|nr:DUF2752 domain-containing protein [Lachnospiraceae bacterium]
MRQFPKKKQIRDLLWAAAVTGLLFITALLGIYRCPLDFVLGIPCPMCGITRALASVLKGDFAGAFYYHPLWPVFLVAVGVYFLSISGIIELSRKTIDVVGCLLGILLIICYIIRHIKGSSVVGIHFETSLVNRLYRAISGL